MIPTDPVWSHISLPAQPPFPGGIVRADLAVIGGGLAGLSAAYHLLQRRPGMRLLVLEAGRIGAGASGRTTGMLGPGVGQNLAALVRRFGHEQARRLYEATLRAVEDVAALVEREHIECNLRMPGQLIVARAAGGRHRLAGLHSLLRQLGLPGEALDDAALNRVLRLTATKATDGQEGPAALRLPRAGTLHPMKLLAGLAERVTRQGGVIHEGTRVTSLGHGRPVRLAVQGGEVLADEVVIATAGYTSGLGVMRGRVLPVHLQAVVTEPLDARAFAQIGWGGREGVLDSRRIFNYFRLTDDNRIVFGGGLPRYRWGGNIEEQRGGVPSLDRLAEELQNTFPAEARLRVAGGWTGVIGYTLDGLPAIGRSRDNPAIAHAVGWCGHGVALSVASGAWLTKLLCDGASTEDLPWYRRRPPLLPFEPLRWAAFGTAVRVMSILDRILH